MAESASRRLTRLLSLVSYLSEAGEVSLWDLAQHFDVSPEQLLIDIDTLWTSGTPGYLADDLIDFDYDSYENGTIRLTQSRGLTKPLRLGAREAMSLIASLNALREIVGSVSGSPQELTVVSEIITQLSAYLDNGTNALDVKLELSGAPEILKRVHRAINTKVALSIDYVNAKDERSERIIEPFELFNDRDQLYVVAFCHSANQERLFRLDRVAAATVLEHVPITHVQADRQATVVPRSASQVSLQLAPGGQWLADHLPHTSSVRNPDGSITLELEVANPQWLDSTILQHAPLILEVQPALAVAAAGAHARSTLAQYDYWERQQVFTDSASNQENPGPIPVKEP
ncbi:WYL domain-containing protein [Jonesiaceae bacterium BS-20]|uniref:WYL domain-containing protein n=1 Tax=Jonesiaceae bacterium BS-20 TaxID=3120821 RepID=A0AAU7DY24_9MICO